MIVKPFRALYYNKKKIKNLAKVYSPPYDIISPKEQRGYYKKSPYNVIRLEFNKSKDPYASAAGFLNGWRKEGILAQDEKPAIYVYGQSFLHNKKLRNTLGFIAAGKIGQSRHEEVRPHEMTFKAPKEDREKILDIVGANLSCIYTLMEDSGLKIHNLLGNASNSKPFIDVKIDNVRHRVWKMPDKNLINKLQRLMRDKKAFIADGHHRYEAAANFRDKMMRIDKNFSDKSPYNYVMMYFTSMEDKGLTILATHRVVKDFVAVPPHFDIAPVPNKKKMFDALYKYCGKEHVFGMYADGKFSVLKLKNKINKKLDVAILHSLILNKDQAIFYTRDADEAIKLVNSKKYKAAFFLNPTPASEIKDTSLKGEKMPHKSTYFYPKLLTGLVMRTFRENW